MSQICSLVNLFFLLGIYKYLFSFMVQVLKDRIKPLEFPRYHSLRPSIFLLWSELIVQQIYTTAASQTNVISLLIGIYYLLVPMSSAFLFCYLNLLEYILRKFPVKGCKKSLLVWPCFFPCSFFFLLFNFTLYWYFGWVKNYRLAILSSQCFRDNFPLSFSIQYKKKEFTHMYTFRDNLCPN